MKLLLASMLLLLLGEAVAEDKLPVPDVASQGQAASLVGELYRSDYEAAKSPAQRSALAKKLIEVGLDSKDDPTSRYVLLRIARNIAADVGDVATALAAFEEIASLYEIDMVSTKADVLTKVLKATKRPSDHVALAPHLQEACEDAISHDRFEVATAINTLALKSARQAKSVEWIKRAVARKKEIEASEAEYRKVEAAVAKLESGAEDPGAYLAVGKYQCFVKGDWDSGIVMLMLGSDEKLKALAEAELAENPDSLAIGNAWWDYANTADAASQDGARARAAVWYTEALPNLEGLSKVVVERRLLEMAPEPQWVDLLAETDPEKHGYSGVGNQRKPNRTTWRRTKAGIATDETNGAHLDVPRDIPIEYDLEIDFTLAGVEPVSDTHVILPVGGKKYTCTLRRKDQRTVLSFWGGKGFGVDPKIGTYFPWQNGAQRHKLTFHVRTKSIKVLVGKNTVIRVDNLGYIRADPEEPLRIVTHTPTVLHGLQLRPISGDSMPAQ